MSTLTEEQIEEMLLPYLKLEAMSLQAPGQLWAQLEAYLDLLQRWNSRTNLTAIRDPADVVKRHFGESLFAGVCLRQYLPGDATMLDLGSGAGFPGIPIQLLCPELAVTLAESQGKKATFLREVIRVLGLPTTVWAGRVEDMPAEQKFDAVTLRAVDRMGKMVDLGRSKVEGSGYLVELTGNPSDNTAQYAVPHRERSYVQLTRVG